MEESAADESEATVWCNHVEQNLKGMLPRPCGFHTMMHGVCLESNTLIDHNQIKVLLDFNISDSCVLIYQRCVWTFQHSVGFIKTKLCLHLCLYFHTVLTLAGHGGHGVGRLIHWHTHVSNHKFVVTLKYHKRLTELFLNYFLLAEISNSSKNTAKFVASAGT